jgi:hypothetical protein
VGGTVSIIARYQRGMGGGYLELEFGSNWGNLALVGLIWVFWVEFGVILRLGGGNKRDV